MDNDESEIALSHKAKYIDLGIAEANISGIADEGLDKELFINLSKISYIKEPYIDISHIKCYNDIEFGR